VQVSIDIGAPVAVAFDEWMHLESLPEGGHRVEGIERRGSRRLVGRINRRGTDQKWEAEVRDERQDESFAWRSLRGSDVAGLVTFHRLSERLTRLELELDVVPTNLVEGLAVTLRLSDRLTEAELRRFKWRVESISPDEYPARAQQRRRKKPKKEE
jgi:uncharacterized membrane protein